MPRTPDEIMQDFEDCAVEYSPYVITLMHEVVADVIDSVYLAALPYGEHVAQSIRTTVTDYVVNHYGE